MKAGRDRFRSLRHGLELVWTAAPRELLGAVVGSVIEAMAAVAALVLGRSLLQQLVDPRPGETVGSYAGLLLGIAVSITITSGAATVIRARQDLVSELVERLAVERIVAVSTSVELASFDEPTFHDRLRRAQTDAVRRPVELTWGLLSLASGSITSVGLFLVVARLVPAALPLAVAAWLPLWVATRRSSRRYHRLQVSLTATDRQRADIQRVLTTREGAPEVRVFGTGPWLRARYAELAAQRTDGLRRLLSARVRWSIAASAASGAAIAGVLALLVDRATEGHVADAAVAAVAIQQLAARLRVMVSGLGLVFESGLFLDDLAVFMSMSRSAPTGGATAAEQSLALDGVSFAYAGGSMPALRDVSMKVERGEVVALVGENGSGKTTAARLLCGLYPPESGHVRWDGTDAATLAGDGCRSPAAVVFQDFVRYALTAGTNIGLGDPARMADTTAVADAARRAGADAAIARLPDGYETPLSPGYEGGVDLSGGQWQFVAVARALFRDAPFVVLDEPTAALDPRAEDELFTTIRRLAEGRGILLISHRFSTVRAADRIYVLHAGEVEASGTHDELLAQGERYAELYRLQADRYT